MKNKYPSKLDVKIKIVTWGTLEMVIVIPTIGILRWVLCIDVGNRIIEKVVRWE